MRAASKPASAPRHGRVVSFVSGLFGAFLGLALLKFGNPPILEKYVTAPTDLFSFVLGYPWPISWGFWILGVIAFAGLACARRPKTVPSWLLWLPVAWLLWQVFAASQTVDAQLTGPTLGHFAACVVCFYLGCFCLSQNHDLSGFSIGLACGFLLVVGAGWEQHFGGLAQTRHYFHLYIYPQFKELPPEYLKRMSSDRIFSTQFYPNALAGVVLLIGPLSAATLWGLRRWFTAGARAFLVLVVAVGSLSCVFWSGSKGGWLLLMVLGLVTLLRVPFARGYKIGLVTAILAAGLVGFFWKYSAFFKAGATSVGARFDYWQAAGRTLLANPVFGTGPGTFSVPYARIKRPEAEMTRLVHNDYLQQGTDSGLPGLLLYSGFILGAMAVTFRRLGPMTWSGGQLDEFAVWLGLLGWSLQSLMEFGLYLPSLAWPAFALLGWLLARLPACTPVPRPSGP
jgi:hypothetical protein